MSFVPQSVTITTKLQRLISRYLFAREWSVQEELYPVLLSAALSSCMCVCHWHHIGLSAGCVFQCCVSILRSLNEVMTEISELLAIEKYCASCTVTSNVNVIF